MADKKRECPICGADGPTQKIVFSPSPTCTIMVCAQCEEGISHFTNRIDVDAVVKALLEIDDDG